MANIGTGKRSDIFVNASENQKNEKYKSKTDTPTFILACLIILIWFLNTAVPITTMIRPADRLKMWN